MRGGTDCDPIEFWAAIFQSTRPLRGGTACRVRPVLIVQFQSTRPLRGGTLIAGQWGECIIISIHPPLAGRDNQTSDRPQVGKDFNPPAPCGAGPGSSTSSGMFSNFNPPAPCGAGQVARSVTLEMEIFQSTRIRRIGVECLVFQSTRPLRGGTEPWFYALIDELFQSTRPLRGGTNKNHGRGFSCLISIHPPLAGRDRVAISRVLWMIHFNPPAPCGAGRGEPDAAIEPSHFNPTAPCGAGRLRTLRWSRPTDFNPPAPCGAGRNRLKSCLLTAYFNPPAPCGAGQRSCTKKLCKTSHIAQKVHLPWPY